MTTKLGKNITTGDTLHFGSASYRVLGFSERLPFLGANTGRSAVVSTGPTGKGIVTIQDRDTYDVS